MKILIVEDEPIIAKHLCYTLESFGYLHNDLAKNYSGAIALLNQTAYDLVILDINLDGHQTGIDLAEFIRLNFKVAFIFLTSHEDIAVVNAALSTSPHAFLSKPFQKITVYTAVTIAVKNFQREQIQQQTVPAENKPRDPSVLQEALFIKEKNIYTKIAILDIQYIRSDDNYLELYTTARKYTIRETMKNILTQLPSDSFFRVHKSYIINLKSITAISYLHVVVGNIEIPITTDNRNELLSRLLIFS